MAVCLPTSISDGKETVNHLAGLPQVHTGHAFSLRERHGGRSLGILAPMKGDGAPNLSHMHAGDFYVQSRRIGLDELILDF
jgi:hypothetical protein